MTYTICYGGLLHHRAILEPDVCNFSGGYFQLKRLFVSSSFGLERTIQAQKDLQFLAVEGNPMKISSLSYTLKNRNIVAVSVERNTYLPVYNDIVLTPGLLSLEQAQNFDIILQQYSVSDAMESIKMKLNYVFNATICLETTLSRPILREFLKSAARTLPGLCDLEFEIECDLVCAP